MLLLLTQSTHMIAWSPVGTSKWRWQLDHRRILITQRASVGVTFGVPQWPKPLPTAGGLWFPGCLHPFRALAEVPKAAPRSITETYQNLTYEPSSSPDCPPHHMGFRDLPLYYRCSHNCRWLRAPTRNSLEFWNPICDIYVWCLIKTHNSPQSSLTTDGHL